ncbi:MAG: hypothetical protein ACRD2X_03930, partial [Vicinamibacteraceae bacterium]
PRLSQRATSGRGAPPLIHPTLGTLSGVWRAETRRLPFQMPVRKPLKKYDFWSSYSPVRDRMLINGKLARNAIAVSC